MENRSRDEHENFVASNETSHYTNEAHQNPEAAPQTIGDWQQHEQQQHSNCLTLSEPIAHITHAADSQTFIHFAAPCHESSAIYYEHMQDQQQQQHLNASCTTLGPQLNSELEMPARYTLLVDHDFNPQHQLPSNCATSRPERHHLAYAVDGSELTRTSNAITRDEQQQHFIQFIPHHSVIINEQQQQQHVATLTAAHNISIKDPITNEQLNIEHQSASGDTVAAEESRSNEDTMYSKNVDNETTTTNDINERVASSISTPNASTANCESTNREMHNEIERRRRLRIKFCCDSLRSLIPGLNDKTDKATVLERTVRYVRHLRDCPNFTCHCDFAARGYIVNAKDK